MVTLGSILDECHRASIANTVILTADQFFCHSYSTGMMTWG